MSCLWPFPSSPSPLTVHFTSPFYFWTLKKNPCSIHLSTLLSSSLERCSIVTLLLLRVSLNLSTAQFRAQKWHSTTRYMYIHTDVFFHVINPYWVTILTEKGLMYFIVMNYFPHVLLWAQLSSGPCTWSPLSCPKHSPVSSHLLPPAIFFVEWTQCTCIISAHLLYHCLHLPISLTLPRGKKAHYVIHVHKLFNYRGWPTLLLDATAWSHYTHCVWYFYLQW